MRLLLTILSNQKSKLNKQGLKRDQQTRSLSLSLVIRSNGNRVSTLKARPMTIYLGGSRSKVRAITLRDEASVVYR